MEAVVDRARINEERSWWLRGGSPESTVINARILELVALGKPISDAAAEVRLTPAAVKLRLRNMYDRASVTGLTTLVALAYRSGVLRVGPDVLVLVLDEAVPADRPRCPICGHRPQRRSTYGAALAAARLTTNDVGGRRSPAPAPGYP